MNIKYLNLLWMFFINTFLMQCYIKVGSCTPQSPTIEELSIAGNPILNRFICQCKLSRHCFDRQPTDSLDIASDIL